MFVRSCRPSILITLFIVPLCLNAVAAAVSLTADHDDKEKPLEISATLDGKTTSFSGRIQFTLSGKDKGTLTLEASNLVSSADPAKQISAQQVSLAPPDLILVDGKPQFVTVTVTNVRDAGEYTGTLTFRVGTPESSAPWPVKLRLKLAAAAPATGGTARAKPVESVVGSPTFQGVIPQVPWLDGAIRDSLLPSALRGDTRQVLFSNKTRADAVIERAELVMLGTKTGNAILAASTLSSPREAGAAEANGTESGADGSTPGLASAIDLALSDRVASRSTNRAVLRIHADRFVADHYEGPLRLWLKDVDDPVEVRIALDMRDGPFLALLLIGLGVIVGRIAQMMASPEVKRQMENVQRLDLLQSSATLVRNPAARLFLAGQLRDLRYRVDRDAGTQDFAPEFSRLDNQINFLLGLEALEEALAAPEWAAVQQNLTAQLSQARQQEISGSDAAAEQLRQQVIAAMAAGPPGNQPMPATSRALLQTADQLVAAPPQAAPLPGPQGAAAVSKRMGDGLRWLTGMETLTPATKYDLVRPVLYLVLLLALAWLGFHTLYVVPGATFGAGGFNDYLGLFLWGFTTDIAQRTLQTLPAAR